MNVMPWMNNAAVNKYSSLLNETVKVLELGSGYSTIWLAEKGAFVESYEHKEVWYNNIKSLLRSDKVNLYLQESYVESIYDYPLNHFDIVIIDGIDRYECMEAISKHNVVKKGGYLLFDDAERRLWNKEYLNACELFVDWDCEYIADYPALTMEEFESYEGIAPQQKRKQTLFARNNVD